MSLEETCKTLNFTKEGKIPEIDTLFTSHFRSFKKKY